MSPVIAPRTMTDLVAPQPGERFMWGPDVVTVIGRVGGAIKFRRQRDGQMLRCGLSYFLRMADRAHAAQSKGEQG